MFARRLKFTLLTSFALLPLLASCASKTPLTEQQQIYAGKWVASDGTFVHIFLDGSGALKTSNSEVTGGSTTLTKDTLKIGLGPIERTFKITQPPQEKNGKFTIQLDKITYTKQELDINNSSTTTVTSQASEKSQNIRELESTIKTVLMDAVGKLDSIDCPSNFNIKAGNSFECPASIDNTPFKVKVTFKDDRGRLSWSTKGLLILTKVEDFIVQGFKQRGITAKADCGSSQKKYRVAIAQDTFQCKTADSKGNVKTLKITVKDNEGNLHISS
ncbi:MULTISPECIES: DUF4333 domain-containing protein [Nostocales]|uniref:DUF4333 domain-containing protein n=2 Tax=Nostocales TaxID=1161 RepID=A0A0C1NCU7_9CYAN|nr:DUF4333 domain-containing protein [Tolypothrix bouteillei]KAF3886555.1 DUF4333 domain-containing protein [Tolypothrix bouteillei VB521301]